MISFRATALASALTLLCAAPALAVGGGSSSPPTPTPTSDCPAGQVWDQTRDACVPIQQGALDDDTLYEAVRELAYAGRLDDALMALAAMSDQGDDRVLNYRGFIARQQGDFGRARSYYDAAIAANPDNLLARAYLGMGLVERRYTAGARQQLDEILARGGEGTWAHIALAEAIDSGRTTRY
ncbi:MAG: tetratricopeptide repeat protein [Pararhodobacter sp.]|nr:tetratricopeptide repeat protein [Pararhodobacter sp.]